MIYSEKLRSSERYVVTSFLHMIGETGGLHMISDDDEYTLIGWWLVRFLIWATVAARRGAIED